LVEKLGIATKRPVAWRSFTIALLLSSLMVWGIEQIVVARGFLGFQNNLNRHAARLAEGKDKAVVLGAMIMMGGVNPIIRSTAKGTLHPDNPPVMELLKHLDHTFDLGNIRVIDATGRVVAYFSKSGKSALNEVRNTRPYYINSMQGNPSMYPALGHTHILKSRGFYIAAPVFAKDEAINGSSLGLGASPTLEETHPGVIGAVVAKLGFEEVDQLLKQETDALAVVSPEGVVFATNVPAWQFRVLGSQKDIDLLIKEQQADEALDKEPPHLLEVSEQGWLTEGGRSLKMASSNIDWKDPKGSWHLVGFADPLHSFGNLQRISVGALCFAFIMLFFAWLQARRLARERAADLKVAFDQLEVKNQFIKKIFGRYMSDEVVEKILESPGGLNMGGQSLQVTVMFTDLRGFSAISESMPPEAVVEMLNMYLKEMTRIIFKYSGTINEFTGDGILILFGAPSMRADDAERAVACAIEMQLAMENVNARNKAQGFPELGMGIGIHTGTVIAGNIGSDIRTQYTVIGSNVNLTARVESFTIGGQILATQSTLDAVSAALKLAGEFSAPFKGIKDPVTMYDICGISGNYQLFLPEKLESYKILKQPLIVKFDALVGKISANDFQQGKIIGLSDKFCIFVSSTELEIRSNLKLFQVSDIEQESVTYAKVLRQRADGAYEINFTYMPNRIRLLFEQLKMTSVEEQVF
jgi:class 3 adenylate cyclase